MMILDASVLIAHLSAIDAHHAAAAELLAEAAGSPFGASTVTVAEALVTPTRRGREATASAALRALGVEEVSLARDAALRLARLRADTGLRLPDCCVLLAAEDAGALGVLTLDDRLAAAARERGFAVP